MLFNTIQEILEYKDALNELPIHLKNQLKELVLEDRTSDFEFWKDSYIVFLFDNYDELIDIGFLTEET